jgi:galactokinase
VEIDASSLEWSNYFKAGLKGAAGLLREKHGEYKPVNMEILADGTVPAGGGLSSSAAFCCASALAVLRACGEDGVGKKELTELAIVSERSVGVNSGGYVVLFFAFTNGMQMADGTFTAWINLPPSLDSEAAHSTSPSSRPWKPRL